MREIALVTTYKREPLLFLCLEALRAQDEDLPIFVFSDRGAWSENLRYTCDKFGAICVERPPHDYYGNSYNLLDSLSWALRERTDLEKVHLVEDDTIVNRAWLAWARRELGNHPELAAVCARIHGDPATVWIESPCVSWNAKYLRLAMEMIPEDYFQTTREAMQKSVDRKFPNSKYRFGSSEQDGFFLRCIEHFGWKTKWPPRCMATHAGFYGYNRPPGAPRPEGATFQEQIEWCRKFMGDRQRRIEIFGERVTTLEQEGERA